MNLKTLKEKLLPHTKIWDCYNDEPEKDHLKAIIKICQEYAAEFAIWTHENDLRKHSDGLWGNEYREIGNQDSIFKLFNKNQKKTNI